MDVLFWFRKSTASPDYGIIRMRVEMPGHPEANYSTGIKVFKKEWGGDRRRFLGDSEWASLKNMELKKLEVEIRALKDFLGAAGYTVTPAFLVTVYPRMKGKPLTIEMVNKAASHSQPRHLALLETLNWHLSQLTIEGSTKVTYASRLKNITRYLKEHNKLKIRTEDFSRAEILLFCDWFKRQPNGKGGTFAQNYLFRHVIFLTAATEAAKDRNLITFDPLAGFTVQKEDVKDLRHLKPDQLIWFERLILKKVFDLNLRAKLEKAKDLFILCCYTGFHYCDREGLKDKDLIVRDDELWIIKDRQKSKITARIKLHPKAISIIDKYGGLARLPKMEKNENNDMLKILETMVGLKIGLSTKIARKTFAHHCLNVWMIDKDTTATMMGLKSTRHIADYAEIDENRVQNAVPW